MIKKTAVFILLVVTLYGCAAPVIRPVDPTLNNTNSSVIHFIRPSKFINAAVNYRVYIGETYIGALPNGSNFTRRIAPGNKHIEFRPYDLGLPSIGKIKLDQVIESGYKYSVEMTHSLAGATVIGNTTTLNKSSKLNVTRTPLNISSVN
ncbi:MAG: hypothetical protein COB04_07655 [Gammaproteobacteria bacterium]|nr:MAG: hypothetical protein COB04_07655 [Gammaproteobacteria bacterium]